MFQISTIVVVFDNFFGKYKNNTVENKQMEATFLLHHHLLIIAFLLCFYSFFPPQDLQ